MAVEKLVVSKLLVEGSNRRVFSVDRHCGIAIAGLSADARQLVNRARAEASQYKGFYGGLIPAKILAERVASLVHFYTQYWSARPYGAAVIIGAVDKDGPQLWLVEPSGVTYVCNHFVLTSLLTELLWCRGWQGEASGQGRN